MFQKQISEFKNDINTIVSLLKTNEELREIMSNENLKIFKQEGYFQHLPDVKSWLIYDHCSCVTRLYAIYEDFVENLIKAWTLTLPQLYSNYDDLPEKIRGTHQRGVAELLLKLMEKKTSRFSHLSVQKVIRGLYLGNTDSIEYDLVADAFLFHDQNLRKEALEKLFSDAGISESWNWIRKNRYIENFIKEYGNDPEEVLKKLIDYRNDAAHTTINEIDNILRLNELEKLCNFIESLCQALAELVSYKIIEKKKK